jgi:hypothetical protein
MRSKQAPTPETEYEYKRRVSISKALTGKKKSEQHLQNIRNTKKAMGRITAHDDPHHQQLFKALEPFSFEIVKNIGTGKGGVKTYGSTFFVVDACHELLNIAVDLDIGYPINNRKLDFLRNRYKHFFLISCTPDGIYAEHGKEVRIMTSYDAKLEELVRRIREIIQEQEGDVT